MPANTSAEIGIRELRAELSEVLNETAIRGRITYVTSRGRRVAAIVPVPVAERVEDAATLRGLRRYVDELAGLEQRPDVVHQLRVIREALDSAEHRAAES